MLALHTSGCAADKTSTKRTAQTKEDGGKNRPTAEEEAELNAETSPSSSSSTDTDRLPEDPNTGSSSGDPGDASADAITPLPTPDCAGKADGTKLVTAAAENRCCAGQPVDLQKDGNCGACGIVCPAGSVCGQPIPGQWGCTCTTNASCVAAGYGVGATCYTEPGETTGWCNCQCPGAAATCDGLCKGGAVCNDVSGHNYCTYP